MTSPGSGGEIGRFLTLAETAELLAVDAATVDELVRSGELPAIRVGTSGPWRVERTQLDIAQGFSIVDEELEKGLRSIAVPITTRTGRIVAALDVSVHSTRTTRNELRDRFLGPMRRVTQEISEFLS